jgi:hypothetical protein
MGKLLYVLGAAGLGAAVMYLMDPDQGNRRRALIRDKATKVNRQTREAVSGRVQDMTNRAKGMLHEAKSTLAPDETATEQPTSFS